MSPVLKAFKPSMPPISTVPYDIIFLDPPFEQGLLLAAIKWCYDTGAAGDHTVITFEAEKKCDLFELPDGVALLKHKTTRHVQYGLIGKNI